jgi:hypothetical protein
LGKPADPKTQEALERALLAGDARLSGMNERSLSVSEFLGAAYCVTCRLKPRNRALCR